MKKSSKSPHRAYSFLGIFFLWTVSGGGLASRGIGTANKGVGRFYAGSHFVENSLQNQPLAKFVPYEEEEESYSTQNTKEEGPWRKNDEPSTTDLRMIKTRLNKLLWAKLRKKRMRQRFIRAQKQGVSGAGRTLATLRIPRSQYSLPWLSILRMLPENIGAQNQVMIQQCLWRKLTGAAAMNRPAHDTIRPIDKMSYMFTANNMATPHSTDLNTGYEAGAPGDPCSHIYSLQHPKPLMTAIFSPSQAIPYPERFHNQARKFQTSHHYRSK